MMRHIYFLISLISFLVLNIQSIAQIPKGSNSINNKFKTLKNEFTILELENTINDVSVYPFNSVNGDFFRISLGDEYIYSGKPGMPELPLIQHLVEIPSGAEVLITVLEEKVSYHNLNGKLYPIQPSTFKNAVPSPFQINNDVYFKNGYYANELVEVVKLGTLRGTQMARLIISPVAYNPVQNKVKIYNYLKIKVSFKNADLEKTLYEKSRTRSPYHHFSVKPLLNKNNLFMQFDTTINAPMKYVIVSPPEFRETLQPFIEWKTQKGFNVITAYTDNPMVGTAKEDIKNYLEQLYFSATPEDPAPVFLLIVGDTPQIPSFLIPAGQHHSGLGSHYTDLFYAEYTNDHLPELFYGRFSARDNGQLKNIIDKTIEYEKFEMPDASYLDKVLLVAGLERLNIATTATNGFINYMKSYYFPINPMVDTSFYYNGSSHTFKSQILSEVNQGKSIVGYTAHCDKNGWSSPSFSVSEVNTLSNFHKYFFSVNNCCLSSKFDEPECFGEALLRVANAGSIGVIGASNETIWEEDFYWEVGSKNPVTLNPVYNSEMLGAFDRFFHTHNEPLSEWYTTQGEMVQAGNLAVTQSGSMLENYYWEIYNLLGDPSLTPYVGAPASLSFTLPDSVEKGSSKIVIQGTPLSYISLYKDSTLLGASLSNEDGYATIKTLTPIIDEGYLQVNAFKQFHKPFEDSITIYTPVNPKVILLSSEITDSIGNVIQKVKRGQRVKINLTLMNTGSSTESIPVTYLQNINTDFLLIKSIHNWDSIEESEVIKQEGVFEFRATEYMEDLSKVIFKLTISGDNDYLLEESIFMTITAPELQIGNLTLDKQIRPLESLNIDIAIKNTGSLEASNVYCKINSQEIIVSEDSIKYLGTLLPNEERIVTFTATCPSEIIDGHWIVINSATYSDGDYSDEKAFSIYPGNLKETFETENFSNFPWMNDLRFPWTIDNTPSNVFNGNYSAKSGRVGDNESTSLSVSLNVIFPDSIRFALKVSSEAGYDFLEFYIDEDLMEKWSGTVNWKMVAFPVEAGTHIFKWKYYKDVNGSSGSDAAWIDEIGFPVFEKEGNVSVEIPNLSEISDFILYPNPTKDKINIELIPANNSCFIVEIYNLLGEKVFNKTICDAVPARKWHMSLNIGNYPKGIYHTVVYTKEGILNRKFIIAN